MDGTHDLGGREGFGPVAASVTDPAFHEEWEGRMYAITQTVGGPDWTIDWFRNMVELLPPAIYLNEPYFQRWFFAQMTGLVLSGVISKAEALGGDAELHAAPPPIQTVTDVLDAVRGKNRSFALPSEDPAAFQPGQTVRTHRHMPATHTRLPAYARDRAGTILSHHGAHIFPDASARGQMEAQHLYTVVFAATELWGEAANPNDDVTLDLWESYFVST